MHDRSHAEASGLRVVHHVPGRMRVRVSGTRDPAEMLRQVRPLLAALPVPAAARVSAASGSVVIEYGAVHSKRRSGRALLFVPLAVGLAARFVLPRRQAAPWWLDVTLFAFDALQAVRRLRHFPPS